MYANIMIIFLISGFWHGAAWTFVFWGFLNGMSMLLHRYWQSFNIKMNVIIAWALTFAFVDITRVFYRADSMSQGWQIMKAMFGFQGITLKNHVFSGMADATFFSFEISAFISCGLFLILGFVLVLGFQNSNEAMHKFKPSFLTLAIVVSFMVIGIMQLSQVTEFIYFNF